MGCLRAIIRASRHFAGRLEIRERSVERGGDKKLRRRRLELGGFGYTAPVAPCRLEGHRRMCAAWSLSNVVFRSRLAFISNVLQSV
jgi:hypothetical protein